MPKLQHAGEINNDQSKYGQAAEKLHPGEQAQAVVAVHEHAAHGAEQEARRRFGEAKNSQRDGRTGNFVGKPVKRDFPDEMTQGGDQIAGPKERVIFVPQ
jgi:uncharacterized iron-regulated membrane protein